MERALVALLAFSALVVCAYADDSTDSAFVWQGFRHEWKRDVVGFRTPHRLGSFANIIDDEAFPQGVATVNLTFTPGVNGDYSFPETHYSMFKGGGKVNRISVEMSAQDNATIPSDGTLPVASVYVSSGQTMATGLSSEDSSSYAVLLSGFSIQMDCDPAQQPPEGECNSDGVWPSLLHVTADNCGVQSGTLKCDIIFNMERGMIPFHFRFSKPFNYVMNYVVTSHWTTVYRDASVPSSQMSAAHLPDISIAQNLAFPAYPVVGYTVLQGRSGYSQAITGIRGVRFQLNETLNVEALGRYLESIDAHLTDMYYNPSTGEQQVQYSMGIGTVVTVIPVTNSASISPVLLQYNDDVAVFSSAMRNGTVCFNDKAFPFTFRCRNNGMTATTDDVIKLSY